jgi:hypothetical protein
MTDYICIGCVPCEEECVQVSATENYLPMMRKELNIYKKQLERQFPGVRFKVKFFPHNFGQYGEVVAMFDDDNAEEAHRAFEVENNSPQNWDEVALKELKRAGLLEKKRILS